MIRIALALFGVSLCLLVSSPSMSAGIPSAALSVVDDAIVGDVSGQPISAANAGCIGSPPGFDVKVVDILGNPIAGATVVLDFSATPCRLYTVQNAGTTVNCVLKQLSRPSAINGLVNFAPRFGRYDNVADVGVYADGVLLKMVPARSTDVDGIDNTTGLPDFRIFSNNFLTFSLDQSTNFDNCVSGGVVTGLPDFSIFTAQYVTAAVGIYCP